ncbi:MAG TPA: glycosyltransferase family 39 protein [Prolixibacteraceae bacterium]|nr:glycosyltransferase family 39 protein [Prolixibacteraceae bacterium]
MDPQLQKHMHSALLFFVTAILLLYGLDKIDVNIMEARNFIAAREMVQNKEYLLTTLNNVPRYQKPPLPTWLTAASGVAFGFDSLFALRLPVVVITFLLVYLFYLYSKRLGLSQTHSVNNALILITSFYIFYAGRDNQWDMYTHSFMMVSIYFTLRLLQEDSASLRNSVLAGLFFGFSILSKGPVSLYALFLPFIISYAIIYRKSFRGKGFYLLTMLLAGLIIGLSWYVYVRLKDPESFRTIVSRETTNWTSYELRPFYYYWSFFIQSGLWAIASFISLLYPYLKSRVINLKVYRFALLWTVISLLLLSIIPEKKTRYLVPVLIPLALTTGFYTEYLFLKFNESMGKRENISVFFAFGIFALIAILYPFAWLIFLWDQLPRHFLLFLFSSAAMIGFAFLIVQGLVRKSFGKVFYSMIGIFIVIVISLIPVYKEIVFNPHYASTQKARLLERQYDIKTYNLNYIAPEIIWDYGKAIPFIEQKDSLVVLPKERVFGLMVELKDSVVIKKQFPGYRIEKIYRINLHYKNKKKERLMKDYYILSRQPL